MAVDHQESEQLPHAPMSFAAERGLHYMTFLALSGALAPADIPELCERATRLLDATEDDLICDVGGADADAVTVDALARLQLTVCRRGRRMQISHASPELAGLLAFTGLCDVVPGLCFDPIRQPEEREEVLGVEEEADPGDLVP
ncbi:MAG: STAS domain-containing protein [Actinomycetota bacterium]